MSKYRTLPEREKQKFWRSHIADWQSSKLSQKEYCKQHNLKLSTFGRWLNWLKKQNITETGLVPVSFTLPKAVDLSG